MTSTLKLAFGRYWEGGNLPALVAVPLLTASAMSRYDYLVITLSPYKIDVENLFVYTFTLYALLFGSLLSLFALLACRPTEFISRIANTSAYSRLMGNIKITLCFFAIVIAVNFVFGILKLEPSKTLDTSSVLFLLWCSISVLIAALFTRTIRLVFLLV